MSRMTRRARFQSDKIRSDIDKADQYGKSIWEIDMGDPTPMRYR